MAAAADSLLVVGGFSVHHTPLVSTDEEPYYLLCLHLQMTNAPFLHPGHLTSHRLHVRSVNVHLGWTQMFSNGSKYLTSLRKIPERHKGRTDERQHGAAGALADA